MNFALGGGGRFAAYAKKHGYAAAIAHCKAKYGEEACNAMHKHGTKAAGYARASAKKKQSHKGRMPSFEEWMSERA